jgi:hypothetical protein
LYNENEDTSVVEATTWETATIRTWLNDDFFKTTFSADEQKAILETNIITPQNPEYGGATLSNPTKDKVFLLSAQEVEQYFSSEDSMKATFNGVPAHWRTRTSGITNWSTCFVHAGGGVIKEGFPASRLGDVEPVTIRPAIWVSFQNSPPLNASEWATAELEKADELGLIPDILKGADLTKPITRAEFAAVCVKTYENLAGVPAIPAVVNPFKDTKDVEILKAYNLGVTNGYNADGDEYAPDVLLNREMMATMLTRVFKRTSMPGWSISDDANFPLSYTLPALFLDDAKISAWARDSVYFMASNGIIKGYDAPGGFDFRPNNATEEQEALGYAQATREAALVIAVRMVENL